jgi:hypothetical protein
MGTPQLSATGRVTNSQLFIPNRRYKDGFPMQIVVMVKRILVPTENLGTAL